MLMVDGLSSGVYVGLMRKLPFPLSALAGSHSLSRSLYHGCEAVCCAVGAAPASIRAGRSVAVIVALFCVRVAARPPCLQSGLSV